MKKKSIVFSFVLVFLSLISKADDGYNLWLNYKPLPNTTVKAYYRTHLGLIHFPASTAKLKVSADELRRGITDLLSITPKQVSISQSQLVVVKASELGVLKKYVSDIQLETLGDEGFIIKTITHNNDTKIVITARTDQGLLYGVFNFLKQLQTMKSIAQLDIMDAPKTTYRILDHWDNPDRSIERGFAGFSIWNWHKLPGYIDPRYIDYARANASVGINGTVLNNVNASAQMLTPVYLEKVKALADAFRPYGLKVYLSVKFSSPVEIGGLRTADPLNEEVIQWWKNKVDEIYRYIPDFGGFLVKANSEGQPGPQTYNRSHADGANLMGDALAPHHGIVMWRAFVYDHKVPDDRAKQAYNEFKPLDGKFRSNVIIQVKNGPIDFQPREPFHPLFGALPNTPIMLEVQLTQEYLGFSTHLVYEAPLFKECLDADTYTAGKGSTVARIIEGKYNPKLITGVAGVANIGTDLNWCGHPFAQSNWYCFGRLAWNPEQNAAAIADDWLRMTFTNDNRFVIPMKEQMLASRENTVNYMTPLGLHHIMSANGHYGPGPWTDNTGRADWNAVYYHKADTAGVGFDRTVTGSNALGQYAPAVKNFYENLATCPDQYLLWFHHLSWDYKMRSGNTLWQEMVKRYYTGAESVKHMQEVWTELKPYIDPEQFREVKELMAVQLEESIRWRDACVLYFQTFSRQAIPEGLARPAHDLAYYRSLHFPNVPGQGSN